MNVIKQKWDRVYGQADYALYPAASVLTENAFLLPSQGRALDLACGMGANAVFLSGQGLAVTAIDISSVAIKKLERYSAEHKLQIKPQQIVIEPSVLSKCSFDVVVVSRFLDRSLSDAIIEALKPDGLLFYQTYTQLKVRSGGPVNPDFLLAENELLDLFSPLSLVYYRENGALGELQTGLRNEAQFIGRKVVD